MPARTDGTTVTPVSAVPGKRFELPALDFKFASLTDGTNIPPPLPSPIQEEAPPSPPETPVANAKKEEVKAAANGSHAVNGTSPQSTASKITNGTAGVKRPLEENPSSPTLSHRQGSIRRFFSSNKLMNQYQDGENSVVSGVSRPESRNDGSIMDEKKAKRTSWFRRLRSSDPPANKRVSMAPPEKPLPRPQAKPAGPPPPMIPELSQLKTKLDVDEGSLGGDLFKDIK